MVDRTWLNGTFDFTLEWTPEGGAGAPVDGEGPAFEQALREQLGLKLVSRKGIVMVLVPDRWNG